MISCQIVRNQIVKPNFCKCNINKDDIPFCFPSDNVMLMMHLLIDETLKMSKRQSFDDMKETGST